MNRRITGLVAVIFLASGTPKAFARSGSDRTSTEEAEGLPPGRESGTGLRRAQSSRGAGRKLPGELSAAEEARLLEDAERIVRSAELVVDGEPDRILTPSPRAEFRVSESLKGSSESEVLTVDLAKAPVGLWPRAGERKILCLAPDGSGGYELAGYHASILPSTDGARRAIRAWLEGREVGAAVPEKATAAEEKPAAPASPYAEHVARAETILVGVLSNIDRADNAAEGVFKVDGREGALLGYDGFRAPITVQFALRKDRPEPSATGLTEPTAGRYMLFLKGSSVGPGFDSVHREALADAETEAELRREVGQAIDQVVDELVGSRRGRLTTIQATLAEWQQAWNARDLDRCVKCYSAANDTRKLYEAGGRTREELAEQIRKFASTVMVSVQRVRSVEETEGGRGRSAQEAEVTVLIELTVLGTQDRRRTKMKFVREGGEWLVLDEGL